MLKDVSQIVTAVAVATLVSLAVIASIVAVFRAVRLARRPQLVVSDLVDATGDAAAAKAVSGLSHRLREEAVRLLPVYRQSAQEWVDKARCDGDSPIERAVVRVGPDAVNEELDRSARELLESVTAFTPQVARPAAALLSSLITSPRGYRVLGVAHGEANNFGQVAIGLTIAPLGSEGSTKRITVWESDNTDTTERCAQGLVGRLYSLVLPAAGALAFELLRQDMLSHIPRQAARADATRREYEAVVHFLTGILYQVEARRMHPATTSYYRLSEYALRSAVDLGLAHFRAHEVLADSLAEEARRTSDEERCRELLKTAIGEYGAALERLENAGLDVDRVLGARLRITASCATVRCLRVDRFGNTDPQLCRDAQTALQGLESITRDDLHDSHLAYNLACAWAVADRASLPVLDAGTRARRYLLHAWLRDPKDRGWWVEARSDPDLVQLRRGAEAAYECLVSTVGRRRRQILPADEAADIIERVLDMVDWGRGTTAG